MAYTPTATGTAIANKIASNLADLSLPAMQDSIAGGNNGPIAYVDGILNGIGYQTSLHTFGTAGTKTGAGMADAAFASLAWTCPITKTYIVTATWGSYMSAGGAGTVEWAIDVDGTSYPSSINGGYPFYSYIQLNAITNTSLVVAIPFTAGARTIKLRWGNLGGNTVATGATATLNLVVSG